MACSSVSGSLGHRQSLITADQLAVQATRKITFDRSLAADTTITIALRALGVICCQAWTFLFRPLRVAESVSLMHVLDVPTTTHQ